jgi:hypothetical protein
MATAKARPDNDVGDWLVRILCAAIAAWLATTVYGLLFADYATARFWETWLSPGSQAIHWGPVALFGLITGIVIGVVIGLVLPRQALKVAIVAAILQFVAGVVSGGVASSVAIAAGLVFGALPSRGTR